MGLENDWNAMDRVFDKFKSDKAERIAEFAKIKPDLQLDLDDGDGTYKVNFYVINTTDGYGLLRVVRSLNGQFDPMTGTITSSRELEAVHEMWFNGVDRC